MYSLPVGYLCCLGALYVVSCYITVCFQFEFSISAFLKGPCLTFTYFEASRLFQISEPLRGLNFEFFQYCANTAQHVFFSRLSASIDFRFESNWSRQRREFECLSILNFLREPFLQKKAWKESLKWFSTLRAARTCVFQAASKFSWLSISGSRTLRISCSARFPICPSLCVAGNWRTWRYASFLSICFLLTTEWTDSCCASSPIFAIFSAGRPWKIV